MARGHVNRGDIDREVSMLQTCKHKNIISLYGTYEDDENIYLALEYCDGGDFGDKLKEQGVRFEESEVAIWMWQVLSAVAMIHSMNICHRDIKPDNFMVAEDGLKLSDFGLAIELPRSGTFTNKCGTRAYMAPEVHNLPKKSRGYGLPVDVWAAGVIMYMLLAGGQHPFCDDNGLDVSRLLQGKLIFSDSEGSGLLSFIGHWSRRFSEKAQQLCRQLVNPNATRRITALTALQNSWFLTQRGVPANLGKSSQQQYCKVHGQKMKQHTGSEESFVENIDSWRPSRQSDFNISEDGGQWWPFQISWSSSERLGSSDEETQRKIEILERRLSEAQSQLQAAQAQSRLHSFPLAKCCC